MVNIRIWPGSLPVFNASSHIYNNIYIATHTERHQSLIAVEGLPKRCGASWDSPSTKPVKRYMTVHHNTYKLIT